MVKGAFDVKEDRIPDKMCHISKTDQCKINSNANVQTILDLNLGYIWKRHTIIFTNKNRMFIRMNNLVCSLDLSVDSCCSKERHYDASNHDVMDTAKRTSRPPGRWTKVSSLFWYVPRVRSWVGQRRHLFIIAYIFITASCVNS